MSCGRAMCHREKWKKTEGKGEGRGSKKSGKREGEGEKERGIVLFLDVMISRDSSEKADEG